MPADPLRRRLLVIGLSGGALTRPWAAQAATDTDPSDPMSQPRSR